MALPTSAAPVQAASQEMGFEHFSAPDQLTMRAPISARREHPVESIERSHHARAQQLQTGLQRQQLGLGFVLHQRHARAAVGLSSVGHIAGALPRSNALLDALTGRDMELEFADTLAQDLAARPGVHTAMERRAVANL